MKIKCKLCKKENEIKIIRIGENNIPICCDCISLIKKENYISFDEYVAYFKDKKKKYNKQYNQKNKDKRAIHNKEYREKNKEDIKNYRLDKSNYYKEYREKHKEYHKEYMKKYNEKLKEKRKLNKKIKSKEKEKISKMKKRIRCLINKSFIRKGYKKNTKTYEILNCDYETFYNHLMETFKNNYGYEWDGVEPVDIDHIMPLATAKTEEDVIKLCHYTNLQLLKRIENRKKSAKIIKSIDK